MEMLLWKGLTSLNSCGECHVYYRPCLVLMRYCTWLYIWHCMHVCIDTLYAYANKSESLHSIWSYVVCSIEYKFCLCLGKVIQHTDLSSFLHFCYFFVAIKRTIFRFLRKGVLKNIIGQLITCPYCIFTCASFYAL